MRKQEREKKNKLDKTIDGYKVRWQFFSVMLYLLLYLLCYLFMIPGFFYYLWGLATFSDVVQIFDTIIVLFGWTIVSLAVLSVINLFVGPVVCILTDDGIHYKGGFVKWKDISKIEYSIDLPLGYSGGFDNCNEAVVHTKNEEITIRHAPIYMLLKIKRLQPQIKMGYEKGNKWFLIFCAVLPFVVGVILPLITD